jgi:prepilin-type N-terminal cleavage/methylation domain-containing protein
MTEPVQRVPEGRRGFTLVETLATLALLSFLVAVLGPMLVRVSRQSSGVTASQYRTAALLAAASSAMTMPANALAAGCTTDTTTAFRHTTCAVIVDTLPSLRRVQIVVTPVDSILTAPDTVTLYRVSASYTNPFNTPP